MTYETKREAETVQAQKPYPHHWYVWQFMDGRWAISLTTNRASELLARNPAPRQGEEG
jgi:hypothetical protein